MRGQHVEPITEELRGKILKSDDEIATELALAFCPFYRAYYRSGTVWSYYYARESAALSLPGPGKPA